MTNEEIHMKIMDEFNLIKSRYWPLKEKEYDKIRRKNSIPKTAQFSKSFEFRTPSKNTWILIFGKAPADEKYKGPESISVCSLVYYYNETGIRVFKIVPTGGLSVFNAHFFTRYNERMNLNLVKPLDKVKHYFENNGFSKGQTFEKEGRIFILSKCKAGYLLGEIQNNGYWMVFKTFIPNDFARTDQKETGDQLMDSLLIDIQEDLKKPNFDKDSYFYKADVYKGINPGI
jgi:hypothetical protein